MERSAVHGNVANTIAFSEYVGYCLEVLGDPCLVGALGNSDEATVDRVADENLKKIKFGDLR